jgi:hypothetical protein
VQIRQKLLKVSLQFGWRPKIRGLWVLIAGVVVGATCICSGDVKGRSRSAIAPCSPQRRALEQQGLMSLEEARPVDLPLRQVLMSLAVHANRLGDLSPKNCRLLEVRGHYNACFDDIAAVFAVLW